MFRRFIRNYAFRLAILALHVVVIAVVLGWTGNEPSEDKSPEPVGIQLAAPAEVSAGVPARPSNTEDAVEQEQPEPKPQPQPEPQPEPESTPARSEQTSEPENKSEWQPRSADDISMQGLTEAEASSSESRDVSAVRDLAERLSELKQNVSISAGNANSAGSSELQNYYSRLHKYLYRKWSPPPAGQLVSEEEGVDVKLSIAKSGRVLNSALKERSSNKALNRSVVKLLQRLSSVPSFASEASDRDTLSVVITFRLDQR